MKLKVAKVGPGDLRRLRSLNFAYQVRDQAPAVSVARLCGRGSSTVHSLLMDTEATSPRL